MSAGVVLGLGLRGGVGALGRFVLDGAVAGRFGQTFPLGTLAVNLSGALLLGVLVGVTLGPDTLRLVGTGLLGATRSPSTPGWSPARSFPLCRPAGATSGAAASSSPDTGADSPPSHRRPRHRAAVRRGGPTGGRLNTPVVIGVGRALLPAICPTSEQITAGRGAGPQRRRTQVVFRRRLAPQSIPYASG